MMPALMPPRMMTGMPSAQPARAVATRRSLAVVLGSGLMSSLRTTISQATISEMPIRMPGTIPARKSCVIETFAATPKTMKAMDGGITGAMMPPAAMRPPERGIL
ncbi:hypothetical protein D3C86_1635800 [compost metagenome]